MREYLILNEIAVVYEHESPFIAILWNPHELNKSWNTLVMEVEVLLISASYE